jgi:hypothetical protein
VRQKRSSIKTSVALHPLITEDKPLVGLEPSAILTFRDEYVDLADDDLFETAKALSKKVFTIDEFIAREVDKGQHHLHSNSTLKQELYNCMGIASKKHCRL